MNKIIIALSLALLFATTASAPYPTLLSLHGTVKTYPAGGNASGSLTVEVWDKDSSDPTAIKIYTEPFPSGISNGKFDVMLGAQATLLNLDYNKTYYLMLIKDGTTNLFSARKMFVGGQGQIQPENIKPSWPTLLDVLKKGADASGFSGQTMIGDATSMLYIMGNLKVRGSIKNEWTVPGMNYKEQGYYNNAYSYGSGETKARDDLIIIYGSFIISYNADQNTVYFDPSVIHYGTGVKYAVILTPQTDMNVFYRVTAKYADNFIVKQMPKAPATGTKYDYIAIGYYNQASGCPPPPC